MPSVRRELTVVRLWLPKAQRDGSRPISAQTGCAGFHRHAGTLPLNWVIDHHPAGLTHPGDLPEKERSAQVTSVPGRAASEAANESADRSPRMSAGLDVDRQGARTSSLADEGVDSA